MKTITLFSLFLVVLSGCFKSGIDPLGAGSGGGGNTEGIVSYCALILVKYKNNTLCTTASAMISRNIPVMADKNGEIVLRVKASAGNRITRHCTVYEDYCNIKIWEGEILFYYEFNYEWRDYPFEIIIPDSLDQ